jgi:DNA-binding HxlR family transcriptional regulator
MVKGKSPACRSSCPISFALDLLGDKWTLVVLRDLIFARKRYFQELLDSPEKIASNILAARLKQLEATGLITRKPDPEQGRRVIYAPTSKALDLLPVLLELMRWGMTHNPKTAAPPEIVRRLKQDRDRFIAELRARHEG